MRTCSSPINASSFGFTNAIKRSLFSAAILPLGSLLAQNATIYANDRTLGPLWWGSAANAVLTQIGCYGVEVSEENRTQMREVSYTCAAGVDVTAELAARRAEWRRGVHVPAPAS
jgi:hypothetical protein